MKSKKLSCGLTFAWKCHLHLPAMPHCSVHENGVKKDAVNMLQWCVAPIQLHSERRGGIATAPPLTLRAQDWSRLRIQSLPYRSQGPLGRTTLGRRYFFPPTLYPCLPLSDWMGSTISRRERIHQTTLNCNITPNISSILQRLFHGGITEAARQHAPPLRRSYSDRAVTSPGGAFQTDTNLANHRHRTRLLADCQWRCRWRCGLGRLRNTRSLTKTIPRDRRKLIKLMLRKWTFCRLARTWFVSS